jgi:hypothetical protein
VWCPGEERGRGRCVTSGEVRLDRLVSELTDYGRHRASRSASLSVRTGRPLAGKGEVLGGQGRLSLWIDLRVCRGKAWGGAAR